MCFSALLGVLSRDTGGFVKVPPLLVHGVAFPFSQLKGLTSCIA